ncbi:MAG TPA: VWA domain-containing protein [Gemmataceae bacterium]|jgi:hypothetical protein|nr:VWA domain-containing protein [Gemmataceae bacterium]
MSFVFPALLGTLIAAGIPVALHLMMRPKPRTLPFPAFRFLVAKQRANQRSLRLRHLLLLLLRMVLIAGLILAIARPRLFQQNLGLSTERPVFAVFVFDVSPSMDYKSADQRTRLDDAKKRADELLAELPAGSRIEIRTTTDRPGERIEATANLAEVRKRIQSLEIAHASPPLNAAVIAGLKELADAALKHEDETARKMPRLLCVFTDTTRGSWDPAQTAAVDAASDLVAPTRESLLAARAEVANLLAISKEKPERSAAILDFEKNLEYLGERIPRLGPADFPLQTEAADLVRQVRRSIREALRSLPAEASSDDKESTLWETALRKTLHSLSGQETLWFDVGMNPLSDLAIVRIDFDRPKRSGESAEAFAPDDAVSLEVVVEAGGQTMQATLTCEHESGKIGRPIEVKAGEKKTVQFAELKMGPGFHSVILSLDIRDGWLGNNRRFATFQVRQPKKILVVSDRPEKPGELQGAIRANRFEVETAKPAALETPIPANVDAVYLYGLTAPSPALWKTLEAFVRAGGGLGIVPGDKTMRLADYKSPLVLGAYQKVIELPADRTRDVGLAWRFEPETIFGHPIFRPFEGWLKDPNIDFVKYPPRAWTFWEVADKDTLLRYADGKPALLEKTVGAGRVIEFTTTLDPRSPAWNNYLESLTSIYVVLVGQTAKHLTGDSMPIPCNFTTPGPEPTVWARGWAGKRVMPTGPGKLDPITVPADVARLSIPQATLPGNYRILDPDGKTPLAAFSVNLSPAEVAPVRLATRTIENVFGDGAIVPADRRADLQQLLAGHWHEPIELFPYFMIGVLLLLALENLLANRFYRRTAGEAT